MWDFTDRKQYHNGANAQNSCSAGGDPLENPSGMKWDFDPYIDILPNLVALY